MKELYVLISWPEIQDFIVNSVREFTQDIYS